MIFSVFFTLIKNNFKNNCFPNSKFCLPPICMRLGLSVYILQRGSLNFSTGQGTQRVRRETLHAFFCIFLIKSCSLWKRLFTEPNCLSNLPTNLKLTAQKSKFWHFFSFFNVFGNCNCNRFDHIYINIWLVLHFDRFWLLFWSNICLFRNRGLLSMLLQI